MNIFVLMDAVKAITQSQSQKEREEFSNTLYIMAFIIACFPIVMLLTVLVILIIKHV